ncbi:hypothetical protein ACVMB3_003334 [Sinorhizobium meliloti]
MLGRAIFLAQPVARLEDVADTKLHPLVLDKLRKQDVETHLCVFAVLYEDGTKEIF